MSGRPIVLRRTDCVIEISAVFSKQCRPALKILTYGPKISPKTFTDYTLPPCTTCEPVYAPTGPFTTEYTNHPTQSPISGRTAGCSRSAAMSRDAPVFNSANFPPGDLHVSGADWIFEIPNPLPFKGSTFIDKEWADASAGNPGKIRLAAAPEVSLTPNFPGKRHGGGAHRKAARRPAAGPGRHLHRPGGSRPARWNQLPPGNRRDRAADRAALRQAAGRIAAAADP